MPRALSLFLPTWSIDLVRRRDRTSCQPPSAEPILLTRIVQDRPIVMARCERARAAGVRIGMTAADARALIRGPVRLEAHAPERELAQLERLARWAVRFTPVSAIDPPDGLFLNITGCSRLFRGEHRLIRRLLAGLERLGFNARVAIAPTYGAAWALARFAPARDPVRDSEDLRQILAPLHVRALRLDHETVHALSEVGIQRIGDLLSLPRSSIPSRFGPTLLLRLDQALGSAIETIDPVREQQPLRAARALDGPTTDLEVLSIVTRGLLDAIVHLLTTRHAGVRLLTVTFERPRLDPIVIPISVGRPSRDAKHLWKLLWPRMERMHMGDGIERVELIALRHARLRDEQLEQWHVGAASEREDSRELAQLCDTIANRIGQDRVHRIALVDTHIPERAATPVPLHERRVGGVSVLDDLPIDRPTLLLREPEPIRTIAGAGDAPPWRIAWRTTDATIIATIGPERIAEPWWDTPNRGGPNPTLAASRDYFRVQDEHGRWLWVYRQTNTPNWYIHGLWT